MEHTPVADGTPPPTPPFVHAAIEAKPIVAKPALPETEALAKAERTIRWLFSSDYAKRVPAAKTALSAKLLKQAAETKDEPATRYVLLAESRDLAAGVGDFRTALLAIAEIDRLYAIDAAEMRAAALVTAQIAIANTRDPKEARALVDVALNVAEAAIKQGNTDAAGQASAVAGKAAALVKDPAFFEQIEARRASLQQIPDVTAQGPTTSPTPIPTTRPSATDARLK